MSVCFVACPTDKALDSLASYGSVVTLMPSHSQSFEQDWDDQLLQRLKDCGFDYDNDFVVCTGPSTAVTSLVSLTITRSPMIRVLIFDTRFNGYRIKVLTNENY